MTNTATHPVAVQLNTLAAELNTTFMEREDLVRASILALLTKEHVFGLGAPGTAKSQFFRTLAKAFVNARYFEVALSKTRPAEAVKGPLDIPAFRDKGDYRHKRKGFATDSELIFLDEIGKASPVLGHDLLALLNERIGHEVDESGNSTFDAPLSTAFTGSNEMLTDESDDNAAIWDRLLFRVHVGYIQDTDNFKKLLTTDMAEPTTTIEWSDFADAVENHVPAVTLSEAVLEGLVGLREQFNRENLSVSDRRWRASVKALKANAFLNGRSEAVESDIEALIYTLWELPQQIEKVERLCKAASNPYYEVVIKLKDALKEVEDAVDERLKDSTEVRADYAIEATKKLRTAHEQIQTLQMSANMDGRDVPPEMAKVSAEVERIGERVLRELMEQSEEHIETLKKSLWGDK